MKKLQANKVNRYIIAALSSIVSGAIIGLLFAPDKGTDTRQKLSQKSDDYLQKIRDDIKQLRTSLNKRAEKARQEIHEMGDNARGKGNDILKTAGKLTSYDEWTKEELTERAKSTGIEGYSKMDKEELIDALRNH